jgi:competence protein ComEC
MASEAIVLDDAGRDSEDDAALQHNLWRRLRGLSSGLEGFALRVEHFLGAAGFDRAPWLAVAFAAGIGLWFGLGNSWQWAAVAAFCGAVALAALGLLGGEGRFPFLRQSLSLAAMAVAAGCLTVWAKSALVGVPGIERPLIGVFTGEVISRQEQPADDRVRLLLASRHPDSGQAIRIRVNVPTKHDRAEASEGSIVRVKARLMPPAPPMLPGGYNFARTAWFEGIAATGGALGPVEVVNAGRQTGWVKRLQRRLSAHVQASIDGSAGGIAAAFASGDRGRIGVEDEDAMRDAGLTHLLSVSGLHVSAVIAGFYFLAMRLFALWPWLALRVRLPIFAAGTGAAAGIAYTLLTGAQVPTVRSCAGALLVLLAMTLGREPLSLRLLAVAALFVMLLWPEAVVGPSFQMSFASVLAIVSLHSSAPVRRFLAHSDEGWLKRTGKRLAMLLVTGLVIELALMPLAFYHFHRAGVFGALANVIAIPLTTFVTMPLIALALFLDSIGAGAPAWWLAGKSLDLLLAIAHWTASRPGAVNHLPAMGAGSFVLFLGGALWLALWRGKVRLLGLVPTALATVSLFMLKPPDLLISGDGHHVGITGETGDRLLILRDSKSSFARDNLTEIAGMAGEVALLAEWPGARCSPDFCAALLQRGGRNWKLLIARGTVSAPERELAAACDLSDIVIADRWLPRSCRPKWLKADRNLLDRTGGVTIDLGAGQVKTVAAGEGAHGWWRVRTRPSRFKPSAAVENKVQPTELK